MKNLDGVRILHIVKGIDIGGNSGGAENFGVHLVQALKKRNVNVELCAFLQYGTSAEQSVITQLRNEGIDVFFACLSKRNNILVARKNINKWINDHNIQIVHSHYQVGTITCLSLKYITNGKIILRTAHANLEFGKSINGMISRIVFRNFLYPLLLDYEIGVSRTITESLNRQIIRRIIHKPAFWIPNAIPDKIEIGEDDDPLSEYLGDGIEPQWLITTIGILLPGKKLDILIKSMSEVIKTISEAKLVIVGYGSEYDYLVNLSKTLGVYDSCWFLGQQRNIHSILQKTNVFVLPSSSEGLSTVLLEAIQCKVPIIASDIMGNRELIQDGISGWLVPVSNAQALSRAIIRAYQQPEKIRNMAEAAFAQISTYSISSVCDKYINAYIKLLQS